MEPHGLFFLSTNTDPYIHVALEAYLMQNLPAEYYALLCYTNRSSVIMGRHQNPWLEANIPYLQQHHIPLVRRISGGGTVYHDLGNLNLSFITSDALFNLDLHFQILMQPLMARDIDGIRTHPHNDLLIAGKKCSGSAYYYSKGRKLHHTSLLVDTDVTCLTHALDAPTLHYSTHATRSRKSEVINLSQVNPNLSISFLIQTYKQAWKKYWGEHWIEPSWKSLVTDEHGFWDIYNEKKSFSWLYKMTPVFHNEMISIQPKNWNHIDDAMTSLDIQDERHPSK